MTKEEDFKLLKIQTCVLKVNIHCDGCKQKVKKLLQRIEGVYQVNIDAEQQKVTISGSVDSATLIKKLVRAGKHAELWSQKSNQNQNQKNSCIKDDKNNKDQKQGILKGLEALKHQQKFPVAFSSEEDDYSDDDGGDEEEDKDEDELRFLGPGHLGLIRQQIEASNAKKNMGAIAVAANGGNRMNNNVGNGNAQKKGNPNPNPSQNMGMKINPGGIDQKGMTALKMNGAQLGGGNINSGEGKRANDIANMINLAGFHGNVGNIPNSAAAALGGNPNGLGGFHQVQSNMGYQGSSGGGFPAGYATGQHPSSMMMNMNGHNHPAAAAAAASMMMNMQNRHMLQQQQQPQPQPQPQMMYHRSPFIPPNTGYYYNYSPVPYTEQPNYHGDNSAVATHMFSDENTSSCSIM